MYVRVRLAMTSCVYVENQIMLGGLYGAESFRELFGTETLDWILRLERSSLMNESSPIYSLTIQSGMVCLFD